mmetsp:Transcript_15053/g.28278  ORF Transcript_15053/g.28278 Transcript_15053/m.28278 type:complete len:205 (-) Transcript_15053:194-808(-)
MASDPVRVAITAAQRDPGSRRKVLELAAFGWSWQQAMKKEKVEALPLLVAALARHQNDVEVVLEVSFALSYIIHDDEDLRRQAEAEAAQEKDAADPMDLDVGLSGACTEAAWSDTRSVGNMSESERAASACPESPDDWGVPEVAEWLGAAESGKFLRYVDVFRQNEIDGRTLRSLTKEDLKEDLQVKELGIRKALLLAIERLFA